MRVQVTVVAARGDSDIHIFTGRVPRPQAIHEAQQERMKGDQFPYPDKTQFIVMWLEVDPTQPQRSAQELKKAVTAAENAFSGKIHH